MNAKPFQSSNQIRARFTRVMSDMYQQEVPLYKKMLAIANKVNQQFIENIEALTDNQTRLLKSEHHAAIRVGSAAELSMIRRLFAVMGMHPVDYYDLSVAGIPVHSTAFRALDKDDLDSSPFRVFCSLLRLELIENKSLRKQANEILAKRQIFPEELLKLIELSEKQAGLTPDQANSFINYALEVFRWHEKSTVEKPIYDELRSAHGLVTDIVSFKGPHINHLTPKILDIDACQKQFVKNDIKAKAIVEGPPKRNCPILLRQTSFLAIAENVVFADKQTGTHTARFGEVEQRGIALTKKGRKLYDELLSQARNGNNEIDYEIRLNQAFVNFPDNHDEIRQQELGYFYYSANTANKIETNTAVDIELLIENNSLIATPITYEDFLPVSAAGIFTSNLSNESDVNAGLESTSVQNQVNNRKRFEDALGTKIINSFDIYRTIQETSLNDALETLRNNTRIELTTF